jgi:acetolactate synthase-1/2/3 large subunit
MTGAETLVEMLLAYGVEFVFGVPGDTSLPLYDALYKAAPRIRHVLARDERSASFMADAYARVTHRPGVCECPSGAGALYSIPGIAEANSSSIPVILLTSDISLSGEGKGTITELDHHKLLEPVTKWSSFIKLPDKIPETLRRAFRIATTGRPGAVHLAFPAEVMAGQMNSGKAAIYAEDECRRYPAYRTRGNADQIKQLADLLIAAQRPVIITGGGAVHSRSGDTIKSVAELLSIPVVTTISGQGIMPDDHPLALGVIGDNGFHPHAHKAIDESDTLLYVGCKMGSVSTIKWTKPSLRSEVKILQIDIDPTMLANNYENELSVAGDARLVLEDLYALLSEMISERAASDWVRQLNQDRQDFWEQSLSQLRSNEVPIKPQRVIHAVNRRLPESAVVIADAGTPTPYITRFLRLRGGESRFIIPRAYGGLGYAIPAVVGAFLARPDARVVGMFGDGSLGMSAGELETLARLNVPAVLIHFNNGAFGWIKALQAIHSGGRFISVDFTTGDMSAVARAFGIKSYRVTTADELESALDTAFSHDGPIFLDVVSESETTELPPVYSWEQMAQTVSPVDTELSIGR